MANLNNKLVTIDDDRFYVLGKVLVDNCPYTTEDLKIMWGSADTILRNNEYYFICLVKYFELEVIIYLF